MKPTKHQELVQNKWDSLEYEATDNPLAVQFDIAQNLAGAWIGEIETSSEDYTNATAYLVQDVHENAQDILLFTHADAEQDAFEHCYAYGVDTDGCFVKFGKSDDVVLLCSDLRTTVALAQTTGYTALFTLYPENINSVAEALIDNKCLVKVLICDDHYEKNDDQTHKLAYVLERPKSASLLDKALKSPDMLLEKINESFATPKKIEDDLSHSIIRKNNGLLLLIQIEKLIHKCLDISVHQAKVAALYVFFTHCIDVFYYSALLLVTAPTKQCGKSNCLYILEHLSFNPMAVKGITKAALETYINNEHTLVLDEMDRVLKSSPEIATTLNAGIEAGAKSTLMGKNGIPIQRKTFGAKIIGMIGYPIETLYDRSIIIKLQRKNTNNEKINAKKKSRSLKKLQRELQEWATLHKETIATTKVQPLAVSNDRYRDNYHPLLQIAACIAPQVEQAVRESALVLVAGQEKNEFGPEQLLQSIKIIFEENGQTFLSSTQLVAALIDEDDSPWRCSNAGSKPINPMTLARALADFDIAPDRTNKTKSNGKREQPRGYCVTQFKDAFERYCPEKLEVDA